MIKILIIILLSFVSQLVFSQQVFPINYFNPKEDYENIYVKKIETSESSTLFVIWVKKEVKSHKHVKHKESIYVLAGTGKMTIGEKIFSIKPGDYFVIPENTFHSLKVTSKKPIKVLSIQAPEFLGVDRVFETEVKK
ncbi:MAG: hypothetical protein COA97_11225 [Flavobacteriales bacterium]|nr:MAG: hypothetical protein COA97_11225 [Flavobacteriales bacterium]